MSMFKLISKWNNASETFRAQQYILNLAKEEDLVKIEEAIKHCCDNIKAPLVLTTGGTGFSHRDVTPEATKNCIEREARGICDAIRMYSLEFTDKAMLSRAVSGLRGDSLIINLPGSEKAVKEALDVILGAVGHGLNVLLGENED